MKSINRIKHLPLPIFLFLLLIVYSCRRATYSKLIESSFQYLPPDYDQVRIQATTDSLKFSLRPDFFNKIRSFNSFLSGNKQFVSFYNRQSRSICIYDIGNQEIRKIVPLYDTIMGSRADNVTVYVSALDSIWVTTKPKLYLLDSLGNAKMAYDLLPSEISVEGKGEGIKRATQIELDNTKPVVCINGILYMSVRPSYLTSRTLHAQKKMHLMYAIDFSKYTSSIIYNFPKSYWKKYLGHYFLDFHYCMNEKGNFVISFVGDENLYVTNLRDTSISYLGTSKFLQKGIKPLEREGLGSREETQHYDSYDKYGPIYADQYHQRYLRVAQRARYKDSLRTEKYDSTQSLIVFDENYRIIGESYIPSNISLKHLFITKKGEIFARVDKDSEYTISFIRLAYVEKANSMLGIIKK